MPYLISSLILLDGWRRQAVAFVAGLLASLAQAPISIAPLLFISIPVLVWLLDSAALGKPPRQAWRAMTATGWFFGLGFFLATFYWLGAAFLVEAEKFAWAMPLAVLILPAGLALLWGLGCGLLAWVWSGHVSRVLWLALALSAMEYLRGFLFTGLPWGGFGPAFASNLVTMQALSIVGPNGMALLSLLVAALPVYLFAEDKECRIARGLGLGSIILLVLVIGFGVMRLSTPTQYADDAPVLRLVQPNIAQAEKWKLENRSWIFNRLLGMTSLDTSDYPADKVDMVIWPESAIPFYLIEQPAALAAIAQALPDKAGLITGALRRVANDTNIEVRNAIYQLGSDGTVMGAYDKVHLVPFGEYLPFQSWLERIGLEQLTRLKGGFAAGNQYKLLTSKKLGKVLPLICYEVAFSSQLLAYEEQADWIINVTNDAWFGDSLGPRQHLAAAQMRAIETGLPLVRVANTGVSAIIDPQGRVLFSLDLGTDGLIQQPLPTKIASGPFVSWGTGIFAITWFSCLILAGWLRRKRHLG